MMTKTVKNYATANIFGPYILRMRQIPGRKCANTSRDKEREKRHAQPGVVHHHPQAARVRVQDHNVKVYPVKGAQGFAQGL